MCIVGWCIPNAHRLYSGTGVIRDTKRASFVWEVYPDLTPPPRVHWICTLHCICILLCEVWTWFFEHSFIKIVRISCTIGLPLQKMRQNSQLSSAPIHSSMIRPSSVVHPFTRQSIHNPPTNPSIHNPSIIHHPSIHNPPIHNPSVTNRPIYPSMSMPLRFLQLEPRHARTTPC